MMGTKKNAKVRFHDIYGNVTEGEGFFYKPTDEEVQLNTRISEWMEFKEVCSDFTISLDAMAKAEEKVGKNLDLLTSYTRKVYHLLFVGRNIIQPDRNFALLTAPADIRAKALAEVLNENGRS